MHGLQRNRYESLKCAVLALACCSTLLFGCEKDEAPAELPESTQPLVQTITRAGGLAAALGAPLVPELLALGKIRDKATDADGRTRIETAISSNSVVTDQACVTYSWTALTCSVTFSRCVLEVNGASLDGTVKITVAIRPTTSATLAFSQLKVGDNTFDGTVTVEPSVSKASAKLIADLSYSSGSDALTLRDTTVAYSSGKATINGQGSVKTTKLDTAFTATELAWNKGDCLPSGGTVSYTEGSATVTITFLSTTPQTGVVLVKVGSLPAKDVAMFSGC